MVQRPEVTSRLCDIARPKPSSGFPTSSSYWQDSMQGAQIIDDLVDDNGGDTSF